MFRKTIDEISMAAMQFEIQNNAALSELDENNFLNSHKKLIANCENYLKTLKSYSNTIEISPSNNNSNNNTINTISISNNVNNNDSNNNASDNTQMVDEQANPNKLSIKDSGLILELINKTQNGYELCQRLKQIDFDFSYTNDRKFFLETIAKTINKQISNFNELKAVINILKENGASISIFSAILKFIDKLKTIVTDPKQIQELLAIIPSRACKELSDHINTDILLTLNLNAIADIHHKLAEVSLSIHNQQKTSNIFINLIPKSHFINLLKTEEDYKTFRKIFGNNNVALGEVFSKILDFVNNPEYINKLFNYHDLSFIKKIICKKNKESEFLFQEKMNELINNEEYKKKVFEGLSKSKITSIQSFLKKSLSIKSEDNLDNNRTDSDSDSDSDFNNNDSYNNQSTNNNFTFNNSNNETNNAQLIKKRKPFPITTVNSNNKLSDVNNFPNENLNDLSNNKKIKTVNVPTMSTPTLFKPTPVQREIPKSTLAQIQEFVSAQNPRKQ